MDQSSVTDMTMQAHCSTLKILQMRFKQPICYWSHLSQLFNRFKGFRQDYGGKRRNPCSSTSLLLRTPAVGEIIWTFKPATNYEVVILAGEAESAAFGV